MRFIGVVGFSMTLLLENFLFQTDWTVWPAAQFINFYFLPPHYRVLYVNLVTTLYNVFLSHIKHKELVTHES